MHKLNKYDTIILSAYFILALAIWTIPATNLPYLFGEGDSYWHYGLSEAIADSDHAGPLQPFSYINKYFLWNPTMGPLAREYPPVNHINYANIILFGSNPYISIGIFKAISSFIVFLSVYLLARALFSQIIAAISALGVIFSSRAFSTYLFGQQPTTISFIFIPLILYCTYKIMECVEKPEGETSENPTKYLIMMGLLLSAQFILHLQGLYVSIILVAVICIIFFVRFLISKKLSSIKSFFGKREILYIILAAAICLALTIPFLSIYTGAPMSNEDVRDTAASRIIRWGVDYNLIQGNYPPSFVSEVNEYRWIFICLLLIGIALSLVSFRKNNHLFMLACLFGTYLVFHSDLFLNYGYARIARMLIFEPYIFWIFIGIGASYIINSVSSLLQGIVNKSISKNILLIGLLALIFIQLGLPVLADAKAAYPAFSRINQEDLSAFNWMKTNTAQNSSIFIKTIQPTENQLFYKDNAIRAYAQRAGYSSRNISADILSWNLKYENASKKYSMVLPKINERYLYLNYNDLYKAAMIYPQYQQVIEYYKEYERNYLSNLSIVYKSENIIIYNITGVTIQ